MSLRKTLEVLSLSTCQAPGGWPSLTPLKLGMVMWLAWASDDMRVDVKMVLQTKVWRVQLYLLPRRSKTPVLIWSLHWAQSLSDHKWTETNPTLGNQLDMEGPGGKKSNLYYIKPLDYVAFVTAPHGSLSWLICLQNQKEIKFQGYLDVENFTEHFLLPSSPSCSLMSRPPLPCHPLLGKLFRKMELISSFDILAYWVVIPSGPSLDSCSLSARAMSSQQAQVQKVVRMGHIGGGQIIPTRRTTYSPNLTHMNWSSESSGDWLRSHNQEEEESRWESRPHCSAIPPWPVQGEVALTPQKSTPHCLAHPTPDTETEA